MHIIDERQTGKNGLIIIINHNNKNISAIFKNKNNANKYNRNNPKDIEKLYKIAIETPFPDYID
jgi:adenine C2-methylase RlmN of 23S rRNA A2503 and tRNA A37